MATRESMTASKAAQRIASQVSSLRPLLACPVCATARASLAAVSGELVCRRCAAHFPIYRCANAPIPWLFAEPDSARLEWKARFNGFLHANGIERERLRIARQASGSARGRQRIGKLLQAHTAYRDQIARILAPLDLDGIDWPADAASLLRGKLPGNQGLSSYLGNIFRDWSWNNGENEALIHAVDNVLSADRRGKPGSVLTLGAGAGRLAYDLHRRYAPERSTILDFNPLLLQIASRVIQGECLSLYEFPVAPINELSYAVLQKCRAPVPLQDGKFHSVLGDALNPPFARGSFDTVVTPWLIDIIPQDLRAFIPRVNRILPKGGVWLNTGSLAFFHRDETWCYSEEEVLELVVEQGFEILAVQRKTVGYLQSPHSAHGRSEKILSFSARKVRDVEPEPAHTGLPAWILDGSRPIPSAMEQSVSASNHLLKARVLAAIDGKRSIDQIGRTLARQYGLGTAETVHAVKRILVDAWEDGNIRPGSAI